METLPVNLVDLVGIVMGSLMVLIPVLGLALRFGARPLVDALAATKGDGARAMELDAMKTRIAALEEEVKELSPSGLERPSFSDPRPVPIRR